MTTTTLPQKACHKAPCAGASFLQPDEDGYLMRRRFSCALTDVTMEALMHRSPGVQAALRATPVTTPQSSRPSPSWHWWRCACWPSQSASWARPSGPSRPMARPAPPPQAPCPGSASPARPETRSTCSGGPPGCFVRPEAAPGINHCSRCTAVCSGGTWHTVPDDSFLACQWERH